MSLYASTIAVPIKVNNPITIGSTPSVPITISSTPSVPTETDYNYWLDSNTYVFNSDRGKRHIANKPVTVDNDYTLKLTTNYTDRYYFVLDCYNTFTNNGNVIIDKCGRLGLNSNYISNNNGTINVDNGCLKLYNGAILNNKGTITLTGSSYIYIDSNSTLTNTGTIDISNITDLSYWYNNYGTFTLEGGSTFILPKSILTNKIGSRYAFDITLNGTKDNPVNIVIPKDCAYITDIDINNKEDLFYAIKAATGFMFMEIII
ncbi:MAG: hypothetical protein IJ481_03300 [Alphaproteobacteria bacterium]|nr:hypothetical protein [Alphaproteobacteria bacterium]